MRTLSIARDAVAEYFRPVTGAVAWFRNWRGGRGCPSRYYAVSNVGPGQLCCRSLGHPGSHLFVRRWRT